MWCKVYVMSQLCHYTTNSNSVLAWDIAVTLMERDELCRVKTAPRFAYGANGKGSTIPSDATITYELELLEVLEPVEFGSLDEEEVVKIV